MGLDTKHLWIISILISSLCQVCDARTSFSWLASSWYIWLIVICVITCCCGGIGAMCRHKKRQSTMTTHTVVAGANPPGTYPNMAPPPSSNNYAPNTYPTQAYPPQPYPAAQPYPGDPAGGPPPAQEGVFSVPTAPPAYQELSAENKTDQPPTYTEAVSGNYNAGHANPSFSQ